MPTEQLKCDFSTEIMLIATPYRDFDVGKSPPKVISEIRKSYVNGVVPDLRPKLSGELLVKLGLDHAWRPRRVIVRGGQLHVGGAGPPTLRLPLRHLSLQAGPLPNSLALCRGQNVVITLQTASKQAFDDWVKSLAIELIRQTPLDSIKYLDILSIAECWKRREDTAKKDCNFNYVTNDFKPDSYETCEELRSPSPVIIPTSNPENLQEKDVEDLLKKCQNVETYVPVKDKLFLFESLCKLDRKVRSTEDVSLKPETSTSKRARSLHDLSNINSHIAVREICKYFERKEQDKNVEPEGNKCLKKYGNANPGLENVYRFRKVWAT